ncbi:MAG: hypothetical protein ACHREM_09280 [Polyangiales bacterium]
MSLPRAALRLLACALLMMVAMLRSSSALAFAASLLLLTAASVDAQAQEVRGEVTVEGPRRAHQERYDDYVYDGFYFRFGIGGGGISASPTIDGDTTDGFTTRGAGLAAELMVGGSVAPGVALGGALFYQQAVNPTVTNNGVDYRPNTDKNLNFVFLGPFVDWHPNPRRGFHVGAFGGLARLTMTDPTGATTSYSPVGGALGLMIGHDFWVTPDFSLGLSFHAAGGAVSGTPDSQGQTDPHIGTSFGVGQVFVSGLFH